MIIEALLLAASSQGLEAADLSACNQRAAAATQLVLLRDSGLTILQAVEVMHGKALMERLAVMIWNAAGPNEAAWDVWKKCVKGESINPPREIPDYRPC